MSQTSNKLAEYGGNDFRNEFFQFVLPQCVQLESLPLMMTWMKHWRWWTIVLIPSLSAILSDSIKLKDKLIQYIISAIEEKHLKGFSLTPVYSDLSYSSQFYIITRRVENSSIATFCFWVIMNESLTSR